MKYEIYAPAQNKVLLSFDVKNELNELVAHKRFNDYAKRRNATSIINNDSIGHLSWLLPKTKKSPEMEIILRGVSEEVAQSQEDTGVLELATLSERVLTIYQNMAIQGATPALMNDLYNIHLEIQRLESEFKELRDALL